MTWAMIGAAAVTAIASDVSQGDAAAPGTSAPPPVSLGQGGGVAGGLLGPQPNPLQGAINALPQQGAGVGPSSLAARQPIGGEKPSLPLDGNSVNPFGAQTGVPDFFKAGSTPDGSEGGGGFGQGFGNFLGGIDKGLQSPSQTLGLGLLSRLGGNNSALPIAGLLGMGLFNRNR
jgi:hypothetical protein